MSNPHPQPGPGRKARPGKKFYVNLPDDCVSILDNCGMPFTKYIVEAVRFKHKFDTITETEQ